MNHVFLSIVTKEDWPGFAALVQSMRENSGAGMDNCRFLVFADPDPVAQEWAESREERIIIKPLSVLGPRTAEYPPGAPDFRMISLFDWCDAGERLIHLSPNLLCLSSLGDLDSLKPFAAAIDTPCHFDAIPDHDSHRSCGIHPAFMVFEPSHDDFCEMMERYHAAPEHFQSPQALINHWLALGYGGRPLTVLPACWNFPHAELERRTVEHPHDATIGMKFLRYDGIKPWSPNRAVRNLADCDQRHTEAIWWSYFRRSGFPSHGMPRLGRFNSIWRSGVLPWAPRFWKIHAFRFLSRAIRMMRSVVSHLPLLRKMLRTLWHHAHQMGVAWKNNRPKRAAKAATPESWLPEAMRSLTVLHGPFKGMRYPSLTSHCSAIYPKILGSYECELEPCIREFIDRAPAEVIDVGCAEGYYAVGLALRLPDTRVLAADLSDAALASCAEMAALNGVSNRVTTIKGLSARDLIQLGRQPNGLLICDCEGAEKFLITEPVLHAMSSWHLLIEMHEFAQPGIEDELIPLVGKTHTVQVIDSIDDIRRVRAFPVPELAACDAEMKYELCREGRPHPMKWLVARPKNAE